MPVSAAIGPIAPARPGDSPAAPACPRNADPPLCHARPPHPPPLCAGCVGARDPGEWRPGTAPGTAFLLHARVYVHASQRLFESCAPGRQPHRLPASHGLASGPFPPPQVSRVLGELGGALGLLEDLEENLAIFDAKLRHMREDIAGGAQPNCRQSTVAWPLLPR